MTELRLRIEGGRFSDALGRQVTLRGINVAGDSKLPSEPDMPSHVAEGFFNGDAVRFHSRPFTMDDAPGHFARLRRYGFNSIRYVFTWEAVEAAGPGKYDEEWTRHTVDVLRVAKSFGFYIFMDPHQDVWSRFCGGSGAPMWTVYACGLNPKGFAATQAAVLHNTLTGPGQYSKMLWTSNYGKLATATIFALFFGGRDFAPKCIIDGMNIQDYLQGHFIRMCAHVAHRISEAGDLADDVVVGWESMNEPFNGLIGWPDLTVLPEKQAFRKGPTPTMWQAMLTGMGRACEVETWDMGGLGMYRVGRELVEPNGEKAWLPVDYDESRYGYKRDPGWRLGECVWAQHGVWDPATDTVLRPDYFTRIPTGSSGSGTLIDVEVFQRVYFLNHFCHWRKAIRARHPNAILLMQGLVLQPPPRINKPSTGIRTGDSGLEDGALTVPIGGRVSGDVRDRVNVRDNAEDLYDDRRLAFAPHWYDGITLITKHYNRNWNVDLVGVLRKRYWHPAFAIRVGETAIRNCFRDQMATLRKEVIDRLDGRPCVMTEFGIPYDMDDCKAYSTGDFAAQSTALDANFYAAERSNLEGYFLWVYVPTNRHIHGDQWNGEDLSIYSVDDMVPERASSIPLAVVPLRHSQTSGSSSTALFVLPRAATSTQSVDLLGLESSSHMPDIPSVTPSNLAKALLAPSIAYDSISQGSNHTSNPGYRSAEAFIRPFAAAVRGRVIATGFDLRTVTFDLELEAPPDLRKADPVPQADNGDGIDDPLAGIAPTLIFLPDMHFPREVCEVEVSSGLWEINTPTGGGPQYLHWYHVEGVQRIRVTGPPRTHNLLAGAANDEAGYLEQCLNISGVTGSRSRSDFGDKDVSRAGGSCRVM